MDFQQVIMRLNEFWADQGCLLWQPYNVQVGAGTMNPATVLRVLGPEPWNVAYVEPSIRPDDGRYGDNPNRWQQFYQYQVILKPDPGNPQELYLESLRALGIDTAKHDVRFVEDNWESPALGAWGLGWEVWLDGQEITQYTYFQQAGGLNLDPVSVEITYGIERIVMVLQGVRGFTDMAWNQKVTYGDLLLRPEIEHCTYNFEVANVDNLRQMYDLCEAEALNALDRGLVLPAHDYILKCSHIFNVLDARGAIGVTERARYFQRMRDQARLVAKHFADQREEMDYPLMHKVTVPAVPAASLVAVKQPAGDGPFDLLLEIGSEELPYEDLDQGLVQLREGLSAALDSARLAYDDLDVVGTCRRMVARVSGLVARQPDDERIVRGPAAGIAFDADGQPTKAGLGFARGKGLTAADLEIRDIEGKPYVVAVVREEGREASAVLAELLADVVSGITFGKSMRWNDSGVSYSRPLRWFVALLDDQVVPFEYAGLASGRTSRGIRSCGSPELTIERASEYDAVMAEAGIMLDVAAREASIQQQVAALAREVGGEVPEDGALLREVANLVEYPLAIRGAFESEYLRLPAEVLLAVARKHQRYFPVMKDSKLLPYFIAVANGANLDQETVRYGNEEVLRARYADGAFFFDADIKQSLEDFTPRLDTLTFQEQLGSVLDKVQRVEALTADLCSLVDASAEDTQVARRAAALYKSDLATQLVVEITSLQGVMGRRYAELSGESPAVAQAIEEHYWPRFAGDKLPDTVAGTVLALADRLDTLVGLHAVGIRTTGAADPWGLRRAALGVVQLLLGKELSFVLPEALSLAAEQMPVDVGEEVLREVLDYIVRRYRGYLLDAGYRYDMVDAVLNERGWNPFLAQVTLDQFVTWVARDGWSDLLDSYARCVRITRDQAAIHGFDRARFVEPSAIALCDAYMAAQQKLSGHDSLDVFFAALVDLVPAIRAFFNDVLVMDKDDAVRNNRLGLLQAIVALAEGIVDLSVMEGF